MGVFQPAADHGGGLLRFNGVVNPLAEKFLVGSSGRPHSQDQDWRRQEKTVAVVHEPHKGIDSRQFRGVIRHQGKRLFPAVGDGCHCFQRVAAASRDGVPWRLLQGAGFAGCPKFPPAKRFSF